MAESCQKYEPRTKLNLIKLKKEFMECKLDDYKHDPDEWLIRLETLKWKLKSLGHHEVNKEDMMGHILHHLPAEYENTIDM